MALRERITNLSAKFLQSEAVSKSGAARLGSMWFSFHLHLLILEISNHGKVSEGSQQFGKAVTPLSSGSMPEISAKTTVLYISDYLRFFLKCILLF